MRQVCGEVSEEDHYVGAPRDHRRMEVLYMKRTFRQIVRDAFELLVNDMKDIKWAIMLVIAYFVFGKYFLYSLCPMVTVTGFPCPGCGLTRAGLRLLRFDFAGAYEIHPMIYPIAVYAGVFGWNRYIRKRKTGIWMKRFLAVLLIFMILFYVWRMMRYFPDRPPMNYYERNLIWFFR